MQKKPLRSVSNLRDQKAYKIAYNGRDQQAFHKFELFCNKVRLFRKYSVATNWVNPELEFIYAIHMGGLLMKVIHV